MNRPDDRPFSPLLFRLYASDLSEAVHSLSRESQKLTTVVKIKQSMQPIDYALQRALFMSDPLPPVDIMPAAPVAKPSPGGFVASIRAMMDEARAGLTQARTDGLAKVGDAVAKLGEAKTAVTQVSASMAKTIEDEAASVLAELGQISNMGPE
jgi:hypothetical protein